MQRDASANTHTTKYGALFARAAADGADFTFHKTHTSLTDIQFTHKQEFMWEVRNTRLLSHNPALRCPMCDNRPPMSGLRHET
jgi:hypothetical protein